MAPRRNRGSTDKLTQSALDRLLTYLAPSPNQAGKAYQEIHHRLIRLFEWRGAGTPEELADLTMNRVALKLDQGLEIQSADPFPYFRGVANLIFKESLRETERERSALKMREREPSLARTTNPAALDVADDVAEDHRKRVECMNHCLGILSKKRRLLVLEYHRGEAQARIEGRKQLAKEQGLSMNPLRIRVHRIRQKLESCVRSCMRVADFKKTGKAPPG